MTNPELSKTLQQVLWTAWIESAEGLATAAANALIDRGMAVPEGGAAELVRLQLLMNAQPAELSETQVDALAAAGNRAVNDAVHEDLCACDTWPEKCLSSGNFFQGYWDTSALDTAMPAVVGLWETLRNDRHAAKVAELRAERAQLSEDVTGACLARWEEEQDNARLRLALKSAQRGRRQLRVVVEKRTTLLRAVQKIARSRSAEAKGREAYGKRLTAENAALQTRVAELEAERALSQQGAVRAVQAREKYEARLVELESVSALHWAARLDEASLAQFLNELGEGAGRYGDARRSLAAVETTCAMWRSAAGAAPVPAIRRLGPGRETRAVQRAMAQDVADLDAPGGGQ